MSNIKSQYIGDLRTVVKHEASGQTITTDAPTDNHGKGEYFSPTDLVASALGSCIVTIMAIAAKNHNFNIDNVLYTTTKIMAENPRRISEIVIRFDFPKTTKYTDKEQKILEYCTKECPVARSLHSDIKQTIILNF
jgi:putative redox protein